MWHDTMQVLLSPEKVDYRIYLPLDRKASVVGSAPCVPDSVPRPWSTAGDALRGILDEEGPRRMRLDIALSDRFVHYQVLPWRSGIVSRAEWRAYALHYLEAVYGDAVRNWSVRLDIVPPGRESLACAIETDLIDSLREIAEAGFSRVVSVRPNFVASFNQRRSSLRGSRQFWFAVVETHHVCLGAFRNGYWIALRNEPAPDGWRTALPGMLRRTQCTLDVPCDGDLYLCGAVSEDDEPFSIDATEVKILRGRTPPRDEAGQGAGALTA